MVKMDDSGDSTGLGAMGSWGGTEQQRRVLAPQRRVRSYKFC